MTRETLRSSKRLQCLVGPMGIWDGYVPKEVGFAPVKHCTEVVYEWMCGADGANGGVVEGTMFK